MSTQVSAIPNNIPGSAELNIPTDKFRETRSTYLAKLLDQRSPFSPEAIDPDLASWMTALRDRAAASVQALAIPSTKDEEWRFTDLSDLLKIDFKRSDRQRLASDRTEIELTEIEPYFLPEAANSRIAVVNGVPVPLLSAAANLPSGLFIGSLAQVQEPLRSRLSNYFAQQQSAEEIFTALNTASLEDAIVIWVSKNQVVELPIHLLFVSTVSTSDGNADNATAAASEHSEGTPTLSHPRCLVVAESGSSLTLIEEYVSPGISSGLSSGKDIYLTNPVTEIWLEENAQVNHTRVQRDSPAAFHIGKTAVSQARDSRYTCNAVSLGAKLSRHTLEIDQTGEQTETTLNGLTMIQGEQVADTHSAIALTKPHSRSRQLHKCIVDDRAHAIFNGKVFVPKAAQLTDAGQLNRTLLLSPKARVDTKPQLEIVADNVKCSHGATVGQLEADEVFYLQSRGIDAASARKLLVYAFAFEILSQIPVESLKQTLSKLVTTQTQ